MNDNAVQSPNWFVRLGIIAVVLLLAALVLCSFLKTPPSYQITTGVMVLLAMMIVLVLSESFNNFSIGKLLTLSREVQKTKEEKEEAKRENAELRQSLVHVATHVQSQINTTIQAQGTDLLRHLGVVKAETKEQEEEPESQEVVTPPRPTSISVYHLLPRIDGAGGRFAGSGPRHCAAAPAPQAASLCSSSESIMAVAPQSLSSPSR